MTYLPPKIPNPKRDLENRQQMIRRTVSALLWIAAIPPVVVALMVFGYSDQAPAFLRDLAIAADSWFGSPVWEFLKPKGAR